ncbi:MAG TPA: integrase core domain-containing protein [Herpetosiphonaceae bacterium]|nr:integrase core domain-containing protein [Herpetosiphonaceae bacterium]
MIYFVLAQAFSLLLDLIGLNRRAKHDKDVEILLLRQQLRILQRKHPHPPRLSRWEKLTLVVLAGKLTALTSTARTQLGHVVLLFKPDTLLKWHRELVRRKWTFNRGASRGRPPTSPELEALLLRLAQENPTWGYGKLEGELGKLGYVIARSTVRDVLKRQHIPPASERSKLGSSWRTFLAHYQEEVIACDFFIVETAWLKTLYVLFFIELGSRRVHLAGCTAAPTTAWVTQQARQFSWKLRDGRVSARFLIHDRDAKFPAAFDAVFSSEEVGIIRTPVRAPNANAFAERWIRSVREECLDKLLIVGERHLHRVLTTYETYYNHARPHQGIDQQCPVPLQRSITGDGPIERRDLVGGVLHDYYRRAA